MSESTNTASAPKTMTIEYLGSRGIPLVIPATQQRVWCWHPAEGKNPEHGDVSAESEEIALELLEQGGFRRVTKAPAPVEIVGSGSV